MHVRRFIREGGYSHAGHQLFADIWILHCHVCHYLGHASSRTTAAFLIRFAMRPASNLAVCPIATLKRDRLARDLVKRPQHETHWDFGSLVVSFGRFLIE